MFEVGARYEIRMLEGDGEVIFHGTVEIYEHPLIKLADIPPMISEIVNTEDELSISFVENPQGTPIPGPIINVTSPSFIRATKD